MPANPCPGSAPRVCASCSSACSAHRVLLNGPRQLFLGLAVPWAVPSPRANCIFSFPYPILPATGKQTQTSISMAASSAQEAVKGLGQKVWGKTDPCPGELRARQQGENVLKPTIYRDQGVPSVQHTVSRAPPAQQDCDPHRAAGSDVRGSPAGCCVSR